MTNNFAFSRLKLFAHFKTPIGVGERGIRALEKILLMKQAGKRVALMQNFGGFTLPSNIGDLKSAAISCINL